MKHIREPDDLIPERMSEADALGFVGSISPQDHLVPLVGALGRLRDRAQERHVGGAAYQSGGRHVLPAKLDPRGSARQVVETQAALQDREKRAGPLGAPADRKMHAGRPELGRPDVDLNFAREVPEPRLGLQENRPAVGGLQEGRQPAAGIVQQRFAEGRELAVDRAARHNAHWSHKDHAATA